LEKKEGRGASRNLLYYNISRKSSFSGRKTPEKFYGKGWLFQRNYSKMILEIKIRDGQSILFYLEFLELQSILILK